MTCFIFCLKIGQMLWWYMKCLKIKVCKRLGPVKTTILFVKTILAKYFEQNAEIQSNWTGQEKFETYFCVFFDCLAGRLLILTVNFWKRDWALDYVSTKIWDFPYISLFSKIPRLMWFSNLWGNSYTKSAIIDITIRFTCG